MKRLEKYKKLVILAILIFFIILIFPKINSLYSNVEEIVESSGNFGPVIFMILMIIAILVSPIPSSPLAILGGIFFGPLPGMIYTLVGATIGAVLAFLISRFFLRGYLSNKIENNKFYMKIRGANDRNIAYIILITRLMPHVSFDIVSYASGLTNINIFIFALVTFIGMIPIVFLLSFFGFLIQPHLSLVMLIISVFFVLYLLYLMLKES